MKIELLITGLFLSALTQAQVGVDTRTPQSSLDVNGDFGLRKRIFLDNNNVESKGTKEQILVSQGEGLPPTWKSLRIPEYEPNKFYLIFNDSFSDQIGIQIAPNNNSSVNVSTELIDGALLSDLKLKGFNEIPGLAKSFNVNSKSSKVYFQFETVVQQNNSTSTNGENIKYTCGIFVDGKLKSARINTIYTSSSASTFLTHTQIGGTSNLTLGSHSINIACAKLSGSTRDLAIGRNVDAVKNINTFMAQSSLKVDVYEIPENFNSIFN